MLPLSESEVKTIVARALSSACFKIICFKLDPFATTKCGILGDHFSLIVQLEDQQDGIASNCVKIYKFFVKALGDVKNLPKFLDVCVFEEEVNFYNHIHPLLLEDYSGEKWSPNCYLAKNGVLVLEDLREKGFSLRSEQTMDENSLKSAVSALARFHACSVMAEVKLGKPLNEAFPAFFSEKICTDRSKFGQAVLVGYKTQVLMAKKLNLDATIILPHIYDFVSETVKPKKNELNVICHSDLYKNNIMFDADNAAIILDYQLSRYASPVIDISILLHLNTTPEYRKTWTMDILKHYYSVFRDTVQQSKLIIDIPSYDYFIEKYQKCKLVGMATSVDYLAALYLDPELRSKIWDVPEVLEKFVAQSRMEFLGPKLESDLDYATKMKDILSEYLDEAKRVLKL